MCKTLEFIASKHGNSRNFIKIYAIYFINMFKNRDRKTLKGGKLRKEEEKSNLILLNLEDGKRYAHTASSIYHLSMASLQPDEKRLPNCTCNAINKGPKSEDDDKVILIVEHDLKEYVLCVLDAKRQPRYKLDLTFQAGEQVAFRTIGKIPVRLMGVSSDAD